MDIGNRLETINNLPPVEAATAEEGSSRSGGKEEDETEEAAADGSGSRGVDIERTGVYGGIAVSRGDSEAAARGPSDGEAEEETQE